ATSSNSGSASASRMTYMAGNSIRGAIEAALQKWRDEERPAIATYTYRAPRTTMFDPETGRAEPNFAYGYVAQAVEVEVDTETVVQAMGYAIYENFIMRDGYVLTPHLSTYLIPTVLDVPERVKSVILEYAEPNGPWGVRGMAEMPYLPLAPAVAAAIHDATGVWIDSFPYTPDRVLQALKAAASSKRH
ncbi:MAG: molybdopterin-dependent oxidoreductase, partial [Anaerolineales bacterium]|nr:molybdopterin-dependent oxidoreductase [Anaerolineales bacterium]